MKNIFSSFVVLAEMRTGSNFLEANLNALEGVFCRGEAFNPAFIGYPNSEEILGISQSSATRTRTGCWRRCVMTPMACLAFAIFMIMTRVCWTRSLQMNAAPKLS